MSIKQVGYFARVLLNFVRQNDADLIVFSKNVNTMMTDNVNYLNPFPTLATLTASTDSYELAMQNALNGGKLLIGIRKAVRETHLALLRQLALYVQAHCQSDVVILQSSGFEAIKAPSPVGILAAPINLRLSYNGMSGEVFFKCEAIKQASGYTIQTTEGALEEWFDEPVTTSSRVTIKDLTPGVIYRVRVCANATAGPSAWSVPSSIMAV